jgi:hypothetical protein
MSSETSTDASAARARRVDRDAGPQPWQFYILVAIVAAIASVTLSPHTDFVALLLLSATILAVGLVGIAAHRAAAAFVTSASPLPPADDRRRELLASEKHLALRAIKELEFDKRMGKVSERDYQTLLAPLRARAMSLMQDMERGSYRAKIEADLAARVTASRAAPGGFCSQCGAAADHDAQFCKKCGAKL